MSDTPTPEERARSLCAEIEEGMRPMGVITTAHYEAGLGLIAAALREAEARGAAAMRERCIRALTVSGAPPEEVFAVRSALTPPSSPSRPGQS